MSEATYSYGPQKGLGPTESNMLNEVANQIGVTFVTYPQVSEFDQRWSFCWPQSGWGSEDERTEERLRSALIGEPIFRAWCEREEWTE